MANIPLSDGEWKLMNQLWGKSPATITQLTERLAPETGWTKHTIITMLSRLEKKGAVAHRENGRAKEFWPVLDQADACKKATASADNLRAQIKDYLEDSARARMEVDVARREIERLNREISNLREKLNG